MKNREAEPSMMMIDALTVRGRAGPTFHNAGGGGGRTIGTKRTILVEILGLPIGVADRVGRQSSLMECTDPKWPGVSGDTSAANRSRSGPMCRSPAETRTSLKES